MGFFKRNQPIRAGDPEWDEQIFALDDARILKTIRAAALGRARAGDYFLFIDTDQGGEWWQMSAEGDLIESYWLEA